MTESAALPIGVLIPTRNSMKFLPAHLETMQAWLDLAQEIVVVDSASTDGTIEFLRANLPPEKTRFFDHPPGLYQSWNHGIQQITSPYTYVSTVGDEMTRAGLIHLWEVAEKFDCEVVISPPIFVSEAGEPASCNPWPIHEIISFWNLKQPTCIEGVRPFLIALSFLPFALLGSSASNLYRTRALQANPFPTGYGLNGDGAWGVFNALKTRFGITPRAVSYFRRHDKDYCAEYETHEPEQRMLAACLKHLDEILAGRPEMKVEADQLQLASFIRNKIHFMHWRGTLKMHRRKSLPWYFNPFAWYARIQRNRALNGCRGLMQGLDFIPPESDLNRLAPIVTALNAPTAAPAKISEAEAAGAMAD